MKNYYFLGSVHYGWIRATCLAFAVAHAKQLTRGETYLHLVRIA